MPVQVFCPQANRALLAERRRTQVQLHELNETLEHRVTERTEALVLANADSIKSGERYWKTPTRCVAKSPLARCQSGLLRGISLKQSFGSGEIWASASEAESLSSLNNRGPPPG